MLACRRANAAEAAWTCVAPLSDHCAAQHYWTTDESSAGGSALLKGLHEPPQAGGGSSANIKMWKMPACHWARLLVHDMKICCFLRPNLAGAAWPAP